MSSKDHPWLNLPPRWIARLHMHLTLYSQSAERRGILKLFQACDRERVCLLQPLEACQLMMAVAAVRNIPGDMAELGCFQGASSKLIASMAPDRCLHLFDTFAGLPKPSPKDSRAFYYGQYRANEDALKEYMKGFNTRVYKGLFPATAQPVSGSTFAFVHLDADLYESTKAGLEFFYPRMHPGGIILAHDFAPRNEGVFLAFQEFFAGKPDPVIELAANQAMVVRLAA